MTRRPTQSARRGFTLLEALTSVTLLLVIVVALTSAVSAGQQHGLEARLRITGTLAAEDLMGRLSQEAYDDLPSWNGFKEAVGGMTDANGDDYPPAYSRIGRTVTVSTTLIKLPDTGVVVRGREVVVEAQDDTGRVLCSLETFVPEPAS